MRPRDLLTFLHAAIGVAINRGRDRVSAADIEKAEEGYSEDMLLSMAFELRDVNSAIIDVLYNFTRTPPRLTHEQVTAILSGTEKSAQVPDQLIGLLLWFGFLGVQEYDQDDLTYSYQVRYNVEKLRAPIARGKASYAIHPAFHKALQTRPE